MQGYLSADTICSEMRTVFRGESSRKLRALKGRLCPRTNIYMCEQIITLNFVSLTYFWNAGGGGCLWIAYGLLHGMYTSLCSLVWLYEQTKMSLLLSQLLNLSILNYIWNNCFYSTRRKVSKLCNISWDIPSDILPFFLGGGGAYSITWWV